MTWLYYTIIVINLGLVALLLFYRIPQPFSLANYISSRKANVMFSVVILSIIFWVFCILMLWTSENVLFWGRVTFVGPILIPINILIFLQFFPKTKQKINWWFLVSASVIPIVLLIGIPLGFILKETLVSEVLQLRKGVYGIWYPYFVIYFVSYFLAALIITIRRLNVLKGVDRLRLSYFFIGVFLALLSGGITNILLPVLGFTTTNKLGPLFSPIYISFCLYSIIKHRLMDINVVINKAFASIIAAGGMVGLYAGLFFLFKQPFLNVVSPNIYIWSILYWVIASSSFNFLRLKLQTTAEKTFLRGRYNYQDVLVVFSQELAKCQELNDIVKALGKVFRDELDISTVSAYVLETYEIGERRDLVYKLTGRFPESSNPKIPERLTRKNKLIDYFIREHDIAFDNEMDSEFVSAMHELDAAVGIPCVSGQTVTAVILLGGKLSEDAYMSEDYTLFLTIASQISVAVERLKPFEKIKKDYQKSLKAAEKASQQTYYASLTRGIANEVHNPATMILSYVESMLSNINNKDAVQKYGKMAKDSILRLTRIIRIMLKYGSPISPKKTNNSVNEILDDILLLSSNEINQKNIRLMKSFKPDLPLVLADSDSLSQTFLNIILNSVQAMNPNGELKIITGLDTFTDAGQAIQKGIKIEIEDTGRGLSAHEMERMFEPFYTTQSGKVGLGLSIVTRVVNEHGGVVKVKSNQGKGTVFTVFLPAVSLMKAQD
ncbi:ATP-binding protein [Thermoproteota archaeon]